MNRIVINEDRLDKLNNIVSNLEKDLLDLKGAYKEYKNLNKYYGSKEWFLDKDNFEQGKIKDVKAGVLSEDAVYDLDTDIRELFQEMNEVTELYTND